MSAVIPAKAGIQKTSWTPAFAGVTAMLLMLGAAQIATAAKLEDATAVPHLDTRGQAGYRQFLAAEGHRAFAIAPGGGWGWSQGAASSDIALTQALDTCQQHTRQRCVPYASDSKVVFDAKGWSRLWRPYASAAQAKRAAVGTDRGERFPDLMFIPPRGKPMKLSDLRGKVVLLHFWGSWCPTCRHELPQFQRLQKTFARNRDMAFIFTQTRESPEKARQWVKQQGLSLPVHDSGGRSSRDEYFRLADGSSLRDRQVAAVFPTTYVLDRHGVVVFSLQGSADDWMQYAPFLRDLLAHR